MIRPRVIPVLLLLEGSLVKTVRFRDYVYVGDPCNTVRIFNELQVDELMVLDIGASRERAKPDWSVLRDLASECFMPLAYGGGISSVRDAERVLGIGFEKVVVNSHAVENPDFIHELSSEFGSQAVVVAIDVSRDRRSRERVTVRSATKAVDLEPSEWARAATDLGAGEILLTSVDREGTWDGYDLDLIRRVAESVRVPVVAHGGCGSVSDIVDAVRRGGASAAAVGSMVVFQKRGMGVLVNFPESERLDEAFH